MKVIIAGGRDFYNSADEKLMKEHYVVGIKALDALVEKYNITEVVCGKAKGADSFGEQWAIANDIPLAEFPADWNRFGLGAGPKRNCEMGDYADLLLAFWDGKSKGTKHMISYMKKLRKPVVLKYYNYEDTNDEW